MTGQNYFCVGAVQPRVYYCATRAEIGPKNLQRHLDLLDFFVPAWTTTMGAPCRLVVFPEFGLHGTPQLQDGRWNGVAIDIPGEETELLGRKARELGVYIASHAWQEYPDFPGRPFSVGFLISPEGKVILKHHKVVETRIVGSGSTTPGDAWDWFTAKFGDSLEAFFPVADTEIGKIGFQICGEGQYAEIGRGLAMNGAEIIVRPNAWGEPFMGEPTDWMSLTSRFNAFANMCFVVESNWSTYHQPGVPEAIGPGGSQVIDYAGRVLARLAGNDEYGVAAEINMESLRRYREESGFISRLVYMPTPVFRKVYETEMWPMNNLMDEARSRSMAEWEGLRRTVVERRRDVFTRSRGD